MRLRGRCGVGLAVCLSVMQAVTALADEVSARILPFEQLRGWVEDDHDHALKVFAETCDKISDSEWHAVCGLARARAGQPQAGRGFFEMLFRPVLFGGEETALFTGYYEPELSGSLRPGGPYRYPLYRTPPELPRGRPWATREQIQDQGLLRGRGLEIVWLTDPVDVFFLQIQGSGRVRLPDGSTLRVGYAAKNGHPYRSVGQEMIRRGLLPAHRVSAQRIKEWVRRNPVDGADLLQHNPSFVFFRVLSEVPADKGPLGALSRSITGGRSIAVDPEHVQMGAPVWLEKDGRDPIRRLMIAQDTGGAIKGVQRADIFFGTGDEAGQQAGRVRDPGRMVVLLPIPLAFALAPQV